MNMNTQPGELFTPEERIAAERLIFARLGQLGAPQEVITATQAHLTNLEVADAAHRRLRQASPGLLEAWDDLSLLDPLTRRAAIEAWIAAAKDEPAAGYHLGFAQAVLLLRIQLGEITGRDLDD